MAGSAPGVPGHRLVPHGGRLRNLPPAVSGAGRQKSADRMCWRCARLLTPIPDFRLATADFQIPVLHLRGKMTTSKKLVLAGSFMLLLSASLTRDLRPSAARGSGGKVSRQYANLPLSFETNAGQTGAPVQFLSRGRGYTLFLTSTEAVLKLHPSKSGDLRGPRAAAARSRSVSMKLVGGNPAPAATGREELPGKSNYFIGNDPGQWRTNVPTYARVEYRNVYPGVDLVYYGNGRQLEHDFIVNPGASPQ